MRMAPPPDGKSPNTFSRFLRATAGAAAVEFAIVAMPFMGLILGGLQVGMNHLLIAQLDFATRKASQAIRSGEVHIANMSADDFRTNVLCPQLVASCSDVRVNAVVMKTYTDWSADTPFVSDPAQARWCSGSAGDLVLLQAALKLPTIFVDWYGAATKASTGLYYVASTAFRNDPFGGANRSC